MINKSLRTSSRPSLRSTMSRMLAFAVAGLLLTAGTVRGDETCMSPYMAKIVGQEDFVYVWTLGEEGAR